MSKYFGVRCSKNLGYVIINIEKEEGVEDAFNKYDVEAIFDTEENAEAYKEWLE